jgi:hypothetical protein
LSVSKETLHHFRCSICLGWWSIADLQANNNSTVEREWYCPWCGNKEKHGEINEDKETFGFSGAEMASGGQGND